MTRLRILHLLSHDQVTRGGAIQALLLADAQRARGDNVRIACHGRPSAPLHATWDRWLGAGISVEPFAMDRARELVRFRRHLAATEPDVIHCHRENALVFAWLATAFRNAPALIAQRGTTHAFNSRLQATAYRSPRTRRIIAVAEAVKDALVRLGVARDKVDVVYGSFDPMRFDPAVADRGKLRRELGLAESDRLVVQVGELHPKKAPTTFVRVAARLVKSRQNVVCALVGKGKREKQCRREIESLGVGDRVRMLGFRDDIADVYAAADVAVNCSTRDEGLTGALREALAMEKPVAATRTDGNPEAVRDRETGLLVPPDDVDAMADAIGWLLDHPDEARRFAAAGRRLVVEQMHPDVRVARTEDVYRRVLAARTQRVAQRQGAS